MKWIAKHNYVQKVEFERELASHECPVESWTALAEAMEDEEDE